MVIKKQFLLHLEFRHDSVQSRQEYPYSLPIIKSLNRLDFHPKITYFVGENGSGKSTLLEAIAVANRFNPEGGTKNFNFNTRASHSTLADHLRIAKGVSPKTGFFLRAESFFNVATEIENLDVEAYYGGTSLHEQSHGESFMALLTHKFHGNGLYILDEPEAALSAQRQLAALYRIHDLIQDGSQFVIATHSPILLAYPDSIIYQCSSDGIQAVSYEETETFQVMKAFINHPRKMLQFMDD
ncbi:AAA family ATPase [Advenella mimigardefordensis]|uniref:Putative ATP-binding protein n=1 Tax=Advenella mimigardefordensis (strain DSM 17166 / LMG 22922 / DPN7) TaxID=1247726 RepID=W0PHG5_ADVMD|nr:AAA family ATPase [Advenella mimigardefordensis]AHG64890.1 putative ATP-binding protein [Advenella mimigardefordensis DPN7]